MVGGRKKRQKTIRRRRVRRKKRSRPGKKGQPSGAGGMRTRLNQTKTGMAPGICRKRYPREENKGSTSIKKKKKKKKKKRKSRSRERFSRGSPGQRRLGDHGTEALLENPWDCGVKTGPGGSRGDGFQESENHRKKKSSEEEGRETIKKKTRKRKKKSYKVFQGERKQVSRLGERVIKKERKGTAGMGKPALGRDETLGVVLQKIREDHVEEKFIWKPQKKTNQTRGCWGGW